MFFQIQQIAICPKDPEKAKELLTAIGAASWNNDHVVATGKVYGVGGQNEADLSFNYDMLNGARELEILHYTKGPNWMSAEGRPNSVSHLGTHCSEADLEKWRAFFTERHIEVAQEVFTESHTNPVIDGKRKYHYVIFDTKHILGVDLKFIVRRNVGKPYRVIVLDTETTGLITPGAELEKQPKTIEIGLLIIEDGEIVEKYNRLIDPGEEISPKITSITGITNNDLVGKPSFSELLPEIMKKFKNTDACIAHNMPFDKGMIDNDTKRVIDEAFPWPQQMVCTVQEFLPVFGRRAKLIELYERTLGRKLNQTHRAIDDCMALYEVLKERDYFTKLKEASMN